MQDVKVETTGPAGSERTVQQQLSLVTRALAGLRKPAKPVSVGKRWSASLDLDVSSLLNRDDIKADVSTQAEATYRFAGWRKQGDSRLAAVEVRVDISLRGTVATDRFSWRIGQVGRATGVFYWDPERAEPAYVELVATAYQLLDDKRVETIARLFGTRLGDTAGP